MRVLILGATGMLGHKLAQVLAQRFEIYGTIRSNQSSYQDHPILGKIQLVEQVSVENWESVVEAVATVRPEVVVNCIGIVKQRDQAKAAIPSIQVNALFPHQLAKLCGTNDARLIHVSTDCVFSGSRGNYTEYDLPDAVDLYGRTKLLGEINQRGSLTLRTSIIGWELKHRASLLEWFATQRGRTIRGYRKAIYTGLSTATLAELIGDLIETRPDLSGLYQVASNPITKYDLLRCLRDALGWQDITIEPHDQFHCDRSLVGTRFEMATAWRAPSWDEMIAGLAAEWPTYEEWRSQ